YIGQIVARAGSRLNPELASDLLGGVEGAHVGRDLVVVNEALINPGALALREYPGEQVQVIGVWRTVLRNIPHLVDPRLRNAILSYLPVSAGHLRNPDAVRGNGGAGGNVAEVLLYLLPRRLRVNVAGYGKNCVGRSVIGLEPLLNIAHRSRIQVVHGPDYGPRVRVASRIRRLGDQFISEAVRLVFTLTLLVLNHAALEIERLLVDRPEQVPHAVRLQPESVVHGRSRHIFKVIRSIGIGGAVQV